jgi:putative protease
MEMLEAVFNHGADAAYVGIEQLNLRAHAPSFEAAQIAQAAGYAHQRGKRLYAAMNTMPGEAELASVERVCRTLATGKELPDALIVSDPGVVSICRETLGAVRLHLSTQTGTFNSRGMSFWKDQGISRVVLPRELSLAEVAALSATGIVATEVFIHGAMCVSISGRCLLGAYLSGRHPNRGDCPQPCRMRYRIAPQDESVSPQWLDAEESGKGVYLLNSRDLNTLSILDRLGAAGAAGLKIEGRNKSIHYLCAVVKTYRAALDRCLADPSNYRPDEAWLAELDKLDHRPYTTGFYGAELQLQSPHANKAPGQTRVVGVVREELASGRVVVDVKNPFAPGESVEVLPGLRGRNAFVTEIHAVRNLQEEQLPRALTNRLVLVDAVPALHPGDILRQILP